MTCGSVCLAFSAGGQDERGSENVLSELAVKGERMDETQITSGWNGHSDDANLDRRREQRLSLRFPVEVSGFDREGKFFTERTTTEDISEHGCRFCLKVELEPNAVVALKLINPPGPLSNTERIVLYQTARVEKTEEGLIVGAAKLQSENMWCVSFPEPKRIRPRSL